MLYLWLFFLLSRVLASDIGYFLVITDIHYDPYYTPGAPTNCPLRKLSGACCHDYNIPIIPYENASIWGSHGCDASYKFLDATFDFISSHHNGPGIFSTSNPDLLFNVGPLDFGLHLGDVPSHHDFNQSLRSNLNIIQKSSDLLRKYLKNIPIYPTIGNHDTFPVDTIGPRQLYGELYDGLARIWSPWIGEHTTIHQGAYYSIPLSSGVQLISLNTVFNNTHNIIESSFGYNDTEIQFEWLIQELEGHHNKSVWIIGHIPPGSSSVTNYYNSRYEEIMGKYSNVKVGFFGHTHSDEFVLLRGDRSDVHSHSYIIPSLSPLDRYPSYRIYSYNRTSFDILDYYQYHLNLTELIQTGKVNYTLYYSAKDKFKLNNLGSLEWEKIAEQLRSNTTYFQEWWSRYNAGYPMRECDAQCQRNEVCDILYVNPIMKKKCVLE